MSLMDDRHARHHPASMTRTRTEAVRKLSGPAPSWLGRAQRPRPSRRLPMYLSSPKHPFTLQAVMAAAGLLASLCLPACSRSSHITDSLVGPSQDGSLSFAAIGKGHHQPLPDTPTLSAPADGATDVVVTP